MPVNKIFRSVLICAIGAYNIYHYINHVDHEFFLDGFILLPLIIITASIYIWTISRDRKEYSNGKKNVAFIPTFIGVILFTGLIVVAFIYNQRDNSPSKLYCVTKITDFNGAAIDFRADGTYKLTSWCLGADYYRGKYKMKDNIITLDKSEIEKIIVSNRLVVKPEIEIYHNEKHIDTVYQKSVYQIDDNESVIENATDFIVLEKK